jgi:hypothetical protein
MAKRLQVILKDAEYREIQRVARRREPGAGVAKKLEVIRAAAQHDFPSADIDRMLAEIESGYDAGTHS